MISCASTCLAQIERRDAHRAPRPGKAARPASIAARSARFGGTVQIGDRAPRERKRMRVVARQRVGDARDAGVQVAAAEILGAHRLAGRGLDQRRAGEKDRALLLDDDRLVGHRRDIGAARGAGAHHHGDLRDSRRGHARLIVEDAAEMLAVGKHFGLMRQIGAAGIDQIDAGQTVLRRDFLRAQVLLHRHRIIGAALDRRIVGDDHRLAAVDRGRSRRSARRRARRPRTCRRPRARRSRETASRDRSAARRARAPAACRAPTWRSRAFAEPPSAAARRGARSSSSSEASPAGDGRLAVFAAGAQRALRCAMSSASWVLFAELRVERRHFAAST